MTGELKYCPHCGNNDYVTAKGETLSSDNYQVVCDWLKGGCGASGGVRRTEAEAIAAWNTRADESGVDDDYERRMDELLCRLTNGKWSKSRSYSVDFMVSCVDEAYDEIFDPPVESHYAPRNTRADDNVIASETNGITRETSVIGQIVDNAQADSREQLEADVRNQAEYSWVTAPHWKVIDWLDRQAAITSREWCYSHDALEEELERVRAERDELKAEIAKYEHDCGQLLDEKYRLKAERNELRQQVNSLTAERDELNTRCNALETERAELLRITKELKERNGELLEGRAHWIDQAVSIYRRFYPHNAYAVPDDVSSMVLAKIAELEAERDELRDELEFEKSENGWARDFLNRMGPKCGTADCPSLVAYVNNLEAERDELRGYAAEKIAELAEKQHVIDVQRESFKGMEKDCADTSKALGKACAELADRIGSCPYDIYDVQPVDCADKCTGEPAGCWRLYFEGVRHGEGRSEG